MGVHIFKYRCVKTGPSDEMAPLQLAFLRIELRRTPLRSLHYLSIFRETVWDMLCSETALR